jgi:hypothetical protein
MRLVNLGKRQEQTGESNNSPVFHSTILIVTRVMWFFARFPVTTLIHGQGLEMPHSRRRVKVRIRALPPLIQWHLSTSFPPP